jgi:hypothetical protein
MARLMAGERPFLFQDRYPQSRPALQQLTGGGQANNPTPDDGDNVVTARRLREEVCAARVVHKRLLAIGLKEMSSGRSTDFIMN